MKRTNLRDKFVNNMHSPASTATTSNRCSFVWSLTPKPPDWQIHWQNIQALPGVSDLRGCLQDPEHHAEGDVLTHTMMVCEALTRLEGWRQLPEDERSIVFLSALLHDIAKPLCTRQDSDGKISSREHTRRGASFSRYLLWQGFPAKEVAPFSVRHAVDRLVRYSGLPLWLLEKPDPCKAAMKASMSVRLDWLALLAEADVRGRSCSDRNELLERVVLFKTFCEEINCFTTPAEFPSAHSRFSYFRTDSTLPDREVYDDCKFQATIMSGLPAAGKDHWIMRNASELPIVSLDQIRSARNIDPADNQSVVIAEAREQARRLMRTSQSFVWNATNISKLLRSGLVDFFNNYGARINIVYVEAPSHGDLLARNKARQNPVPEGVLDKLCLRLEVPEMSEAHELTFISQ